MELTADFSPLCQAFFSRRLIAQRKASPHTIAAYAQTFRLLMKYAQKRLGVFMRLTAANIANRGWFQGRQAAGSRIDVGVVRTGTQVIARDRRVGVRRRRI